MNEAMVKEQARERLLSAELAEVLEVEVAAIDEPPAAASPRRWLAAALLLLGVAVAGGVAWLRAHDVHEVQQREFDPTDPWWERGMYELMTQDHLRSSAALMALPPETASFHVNHYVGSGNDVIDAVLARPRVEQLAWISGVVPYDPEHWRQLLAHDELRSLCLGGPQAGLTPARLRELRLFPELQQFALTMNGCTFDVEAAASLMELPKLRELVFLGTRILPDGLGKLDGLPHLEALGISLFEEGHDLDALVRAVARIRGLRALVLELPRGRLDPGALLSLGELRRLTELGLFHVELTDRHLAVLPDTLRALNVGSLAPGVTVSGIEQLARMRGLTSLGFSCFVVNQYSESLRKLLGQLSPECFELGVEVPDKALWQALQSLPRLRRLRIHDQSSGDGMATARRDAFEQVRRCEHLEVFLFKVRELPTPEELSVLRDHPTLRRVCLERLQRFAPGVPTAADVAALRAAVDFEVTVR